MTGPKRIQRQRTKGWRMPEGAVYVGRPTIYGNPFRIGVPFCGPTIRTVHSPLGSVVAFGMWIARDTLDPLLWDRELVVAHAKLKAALDRGDLAGKDLVCWCPLVDVFDCPAPCHADLLLEIANGGAS